MFVVGAVEISSGEGREERGVGSKRWSTPRNRAVDLSPGGRAGGNGLRTAPTTSSGNRRTFLSGWSRPYRRLRGSLFRSFRCLVWQKIDGGPMIQGDGEFLVQFRPTNACGVRICSISNARDSAPLPFPSRHSSRTLTLGIDL